MVAMCLSTIPQGQSEILAGDDQHGRSVRVGRSGNWEIFLILGRWSRVIGTSNLSPHSAMGRLAGRATKRPSGPEFAGSVRVGETNHKRLRLADGPQELSRQCFKIHLTGHLIEAGPVRVNRRSKSVFKCSQVLL